MKRHFREHKEKHWEYACNNTTNFFLSLFFNVLTQLKLVRLYRFGLVSYLNVSKSGPAMGDFTQSPPENSNLGNTEHI